MCPEVSMCRWLLVFSANLSCLCLLQTPLVPTLYLVKTNAIGDNESLLKMIIRCVGTALDVAPEAQRMWFASQKFHFDLRWGKGSGLSGLLDRQLQL